MNIFHAFDNNNNISKKSNDSYLNIMDGWYQDTANDIIPINETQQIEVFEISSECDEVESNHLKETNVENNHFDYLDYNIESVSMIANPGNEFDENNSIVEIQSVDEFEELIENKIDQREEIKPRNNKNDKKCNDKAKEKKLETQIFILSLLLSLGFTFTLRKDKNKTNDNYYVLYDLKDPQVNKLFDYNQMEEEVYRIETLENPNENELKMNKVRKNMKKLVISHEMNIINQILKEKYNIEIITKPIKEGNKPNAYKIQYPIPKNIVLNCKEIPIKEIGLEQQQIIGKYFYNKIFKEKIDKTKSNQEISFSSFDIYLEFNEFDENIKQFISQFLKIKQLKEKEENKFIL